MLMPVWAAIRGGRQLELSERAAECDVCLIGEAGMTPDGHTPLALGVEHRLARLGSQRLRQVEACDFGAKTRQDGSDLQLQRFVALHRGRPCNIAIRAGSTFSGMAASNPS